jgi:adenylate cyclase
MAQCRFHLDNGGWADDREANRRSGIDLAQQALRSAPDDPVVLANAAIVLGYFGEDINAAIGLVDGSLTLNPSFAQGWYCSGVLRNWLGRPDLALDHFETFLRLSPRERFSMQNAKSISLFFLHRFDEAVAEFLAVMERHPKHVLSHRFLAACYTHMGRLDDAREVVARLHTLTPDVLDSGTRYRNPEHRELFLSGLRLAMGEPA